MLEFYERSKPSEARDRILRVTRRALEEHDETVQLSDIVVRAGVSRQTFYYHFRAKADLLAAVCNAADADVRQIEDRLADALRDINGRDALRAYIGSRAEVEPVVHALASGLERLRIFDPAAQSVWRAREQRRYQQIAALVERLDAEGHLAHGWTPVDAARLVWSATSHRAWSDLVAEAGWTGAHWAERTIATIEAALVTASPPPEGARSAA